MADFSDFIRALNRVEREIRCTRSMARLGRIASVIVFRRIKSGFGVVDDKKEFAKRKRLPKLNPDSTIPLRVIKNARGELTGSFAEPGFSNLTETGQLLDSFTIANTKLGHVEVIIPKTSRRKGALNNAELYDKLRKRGRGREARPAFALTESEWGILRVNVEDRVVSIFRQTIGLC